MTSPLWMAMRPSSLTSLGRRHLTAVTTQQHCHRRPVALFLNATRLDYDNQLDFSRLESLCDFRRHNVDTVHDVKDMVQVVQYHEPEIIITKEMPVPLDAVQQFPKSVKLLCEAGTGFNNIPVQAARAQFNIPVCNVPTYSTEAVAHMAITYLMNFSVSMFEQQRMLQCDNNGANFTGPFTLPLSEINGKTLGLVGGAGKIGTKVAEIGLALGMNIIISSRRPTLPDDHVLRHHPHVTVVTTDNLGDLLGQSDYVSLHTPLNDQTRGTFGRAQISQMKPTAFLINTSRGAVCNEEELIACMKDNMIAGAGLDVTTTEPPAMDSALWDLPNVYLSPHTGWRRLETRQRLVDMTADNIEEYCNAKDESEMINIVN